jgi:arginyl-tRNA synthetase
MLKFLWRGSTQSEEMGQDVAYLLGRVAGAQPIKDEMLRDPAVMLRFWPIVGDQLTDEVANPKPHVPQDGVPEPTTTPEERLATWRRLAERMDAWWLEVPRWRDEVKETFARWERQEPAFVALWGETREWSLADFRRIFAELGAEFDVWFFESEVEEEGRRIVQDLLATGIAEVSDGLPVVKIDEKLGLAEPTYRTLPILRSDGSTLYSTKDLALTERSSTSTGWTGRSGWSTSAVALLPAGVQGPRAGRLRAGGAGLPPGLRDGAAAGRGDLVREGQRAGLRRHPGRGRRAGPGDRRGEERGAGAGGEGEVAWEVAIGSLKYAMLARDNNKVVTFDLDEALSFDGHAAPYIQYAHARACRILEHAGTDAEALAAGAGAAGLDFGGDLAPEELGLLQAVSALPEAVQQAAAEYRPLAIANYVYDLAKRFNDFYHGCPVLPSPEPTRTARLALTAATAQALRNGLGLLGIAAPAAM